jgi:hypothetical protein
MSFTLELQHLSKNAICDITNGCVIPIGIEGDFWFGNIFFSQMGNVRRPSTLAESKKSLSLQPT